MKTIYQDAHLVVAGIRIFEHQHQRPPGESELGEFLGFSPEQTRLLCKKLTEKGILEEIQGAYGSRLFIRDHLKIEALPREEQAPALQAEIERFQSSKKGMQKKVEEFQAKQEKRQKALFAELESKLKGGGDKK